MKFDILTIFPDIFDSYINKGMLRIAQEKKIVKINIHDLRNWAVDKHGTVDDRPYGGGPGQILMVEPVARALNEIQKKRSKTIKKKIVLLSAKGKRWNQQMAKKYSKLDQVIFVCPRYEGHDERIKKLVDEEISIGDYILTGGELGALTIIDSVTRLLPGVLGKEASLDEESHTKPGYLEYPHYSRPESYQIKGRNCNVPKVLLSGHHKMIEEWRKKHSKITK